MLGGSLPDSNKLLRIVPTYANCTIENKKTVKPLAGGYSYMENNINFSIVIMQFNHYGSVMAYVMGDAVY